MVVLFWSQSHSQTIMLVWEWDYLDICLKSTALGVPAQPEVPAAPADHLARSWWSARQNDLRGFGVCKGRKLVDWWFVFSISLSTGNYRFWRTPGWWRKGSMKRTAPSLATCPTLCELLSLLLPWQQHAWTKIKSGVYRHVSKTTFSDLWSLWLTITRSRQLFTIFSVPPFKQACGEFLQLMGEKVDSIIDLSSQYTGRSQTWLSTLTCLQRRASVVLTWGSVSVSPPSPSSTCRICTLPMRSSFRTSPGSSQWSGSTMRGSGQLTRWPRWLSGELLQFHSRLTFAQKSILSWVPN